MHFERYHHNHQNRYLHVQSKQTMPSHTSFCSPVSPIFKVVVNCTSPTYIVPGIAQEVASLPEPELNIGQCLGLRVLRAVMFPSAILPRALPSCGMDYSP